MAKCKAIPGAHTVGCYDAMIRDWYDIAIGTGQPEWRVSVLRQLTLFGYAICEYDERHADGCVHRARYRFRGGATVVVSAQKRAHT